MPTSRNSGLILAAVVCLLIVGAAAFVAIWTGPNARTAWTQCLDAYEGRVRDHGPRPAYADADVVKIAWNRYRVVPELDDRTRLVCEITWDGRWQILDLRTARK